MIRKIENLSLVKAYEAVLSGLTVSFFTPNRIGEYAGRVFYLQQGNRLAATIITIIENAGQLIITIITGCLAMIWYKNEFLEISGWQSTAITWACLTVPVLVLFVFLNLNVLIAALSQNAFIKKYTHVFDSFSFYSKMELTKLLLLSLLRYSVFSVQFFLLIKLFGLELPVLPTLFLISLSFFFMTIIPTIAITELGVRGAISVYFISKINPDGVPVLNAAFALWLINLVIPSVIGAVLILNVRWKKKSEWK